MSDFNYNLDLALDINFVERLECEYRYQPVDEGPPIGPSPDPTAAEIKKLVQTSFWASLTKEEGRFHDLRVVFMPVDDWDDSLFVFTRPLPFRPETLAKIAPALLHSFRIGVWRTQDAADLEIWGFVPTDHREWPMYIKASEGELVVSLPSGLKGVITPTMPGKFIDPKAISFIDEWSRTQLPVAETNGSPSTVFSSDLREIAKTMRRHGHGGTLLVLPNDIKDDSLNQFIHTSPDRFPFLLRSHENVNAALKARETAFAKRTQSEKQAEEEGTNLIFSYEPTEAVEAREYLSFIAELTAADGATIVTSDLRVMGFGAKIKAEGNSETAKVKKVYVSKPFEGSQGENKSFSALGWGTRHQSAAQFVGNQRDSIAIVASTDGAVSFFKWDHRKGVSVVQHAEFLL